MTNSLHTIESLKSLGTSLAKAEEKIFSAQASIVDVIRAYATKHEPLNAIELNADVKKDMRAAIKAGIPAAGKSEGTLQTYATRYFRALVYASNKVCPEFKGSLDLYLKACADTAEGGLVWQVQERKTPEASANTGKGAAEETAKAKAPSLPEIKTHAELVADMLRIAALLGIKEEVQSIVLAHEVAEQEEKSVHKDVAKVATIVGSIATISKKAQAKADALRAMTA